ncbi:alpha-galactosidase [Vibrio astriarenae]|nr:alpha-galactosidase [Vibrio sp. C7]
MERVPTQDWENSDLESIAVIEANTLDEVYQQYASLIQSNHPPRPHVKAKAPIGWCSWYAYYADVTEQDVAKNLDAMQGELAPLDWVLLDDGYQAFMGDWLDPSDKFSSGVKNLIQDIKMKGKRPAIWLAPFIVQPESKIFSQHPDWFVKNHDGSYSRQRTLPMVVGAAHRGTYLIRQILKYKIISLVL